VQVSPHDGEDFLTVRGPESIDATKAHYEVRLTEKYWKEADLTTPMSVIVNSKLTFQNIEVWCSLFCIQIKHTSLLESAQKWCHIVFIHGSGCFCYTE